METNKEITLENHILLMDFTPATVVNNTSSETENKQLKAEEHLYEKMCSDLPLYQDKIKRDKDLYKEELTKFLSVFIPKFNLFLETPSTNHRNMKEVFIFLAHLSHIFPKQLAFIPAQLKQLLEHSHAIIHPEIRIAIIESFNLLRKRNLIDALE